MLLAAPACTVTGPWASMRRRRAAGTAPEKSRTKRSPSCDRAAGCGTATSGSSSRMAGVLKCADRRIHVPERLFQFEAHRIVIFLLNQALHHADHVVVAVGDQQVDHLQIGRAHV